LPDSLLSAGKGASRGKGRREGGRQPPPFVQIPESGGVTSTKEDERGKKHFYPFSTEVGKGVKGGEKRRYQERKRRA